MRRSQHQVRRRKKSPPPQQYDQAAVLWLVEFVIRMNKEHRLTEGVHLVQITTVRQLRRNFSQMVDLAQSLEPEEQTCPSKEDFDAATRGVDLPLTAFAEALRPNKR